LKELNANDAILALDVKLFEDAVARTYDIYLEKEDYTKEVPENIYYGFTIESAIYAEDPETMPDSQEVLLVSAMLTSIRIPGPLLPTLSNCKIKGNKAQKLADVLEELIEASVFKEEERLCLLIVNREEDAQNKWKEPLDPFNEEHQEVALDIAKQIRHKLKGKPYSIENLKIEKESKGIWHVLTVKASSNEIVHFAFLPYKRYWCQFIKDIGVSSL